MTFGRLSTIILGAVVANSVFGTEPPKPDAVKPLVHVCARQPLDLLPDPAAVEMWRQYFSIASDTFFWHGEVREDKLIDVKIIAPTSPNTTPGQLRGKALTDARQNLQLFKWALRQSPDYEYAFRVNQFYMTMTADLRSLRHMLRTADRDPIHFGISGIEPWKVYWERAIGPSPTRISHSADFANVVDSSGKSLDPALSLVFSLDVPYPSFKEASQNARTPQALELAFREWKDGFTTTERLLRASIEDAALTQNVSVVLPSPGRPIWGDIAVECTPRDFAILLDYWHRTPGSALAGTEFYIADRKFDR